MIGKQYLGTKSRQVDTLIRTAPHALLPLLPLTSLRVLYRLLLGSQRVDK
jgi:hypothetical protein